MVGSVAGGKWSDVYLRRMREANNGVSVPEVSPDHIFRQQIDTDETDAIERDSLVHACPGSFFPHLRLDSWIACQHRWNYHFAILCRIIGHVDIRFYTCLSRRLQSCESYPAWARHVLINRADPVLLYPATPS